MDGSAWCLAETGKEGASSPASSMPAAWSLGEGHVMVDKAREIIPYSPVGFPAAMGVRGSGDGSPECPRRWRAVEMALEALIPLTNYVYVY